VYKWLLTISSALIAASLVEAQPKPDVTKQPTLFVVGYAHLDTQWRWEYPQVISEYIPKTMHTNFDYFEKYPHYIFNFSGANRYHMMQEYYPRDYEKVKDFIHAGRWYPAGSSMEESDVNSPSAESIFRQILYGNEFFRREFGVASAEYMLPDCFGFPASLPSILFHAGIKGFSTQKLTWGSSAPVGGPGSPEDTPEGIPFNVGMWIGPDGKGVISALNPGSYSGSITTDLSKSPTPAEEENRRNPAVDWPKRIELDGKATGVYADYHYYGTGDTGGAPSESSVKLLEAIVTKSETVLPPPNQSRAPWAQPASEATGPEVRVGTGPVHVISSKADQMFLDITPAEAAHLLTYKGELELTNHSAGSLTSEAYQKRWNRKNEILADAAEQTSLAAQWLGGRKYPIDRLNEAWRLVMGGQFHDIMAGTATPKAYEYSWNDDVLAMNQFAQVVTSATDAVSASLDTRTNGIPVVVFNQLSIPRQDVVEATLQFPEGTPKAVRVTGPDGGEVPSQVEGTKILFLASVPSDGFAVYDVRPSESARASGSELKASESSLENARYRVAIDQNGDVSSIFDKQLNKELLAGPARLSFQYEQPQQWPAWNMDWEDQSKPPAGYVDGPAKIKVVENGPVRVAVQIDREARGSHFVQTVRLSSGDPGNRVEFVNGIDWKTGQSALKAIFPLTASNPDATYNWEVGTIQRGNDTPKKFEYPSHEWFDLTDKSGSYGVTVLSDCKFASDKPNDNTLRLTLIYTPGVNPRMQQYSDQGTQDWGEHNFIYGLASHAGDWRRGETDWQGYRLNEPLLAFEATKHPGSLGKRFSLLNVNSNHVRVLALKKAEEGDDAVVRLVEVNGENEPNVHLKFSSRVLAAREINGQEQPLGSANVSGGELVTSFTPFQVRTFAVKLSPAAANAGEIASQPVTLAYDRDVTSADGSHSNGGFDAAGEAIPAEMLPGEIHYSGITFKLGPAGGPNAVVAKGQTIDLPSGQFNRVYVLAASAEGDQKATFRAGDTSADWDIENWTGFVGQWWARVWNEKVVNVPPRPLPPNIKPGSPEAQRFESFMAQHRTRKALEFSGHINPGFIKPAPVAWFASHRHTADGQNEPYSYAYLFAYEMDVPAGAHSLTLPDNDKIRVMAVTVAQENTAAHPVQPLLDETPSEAASVPNGG
jgi:alpha-mannosidase